MKKSNNILRIGFQNIGGLPATRNKPKDSLLQRGIESYQFDMMGMAGGGKCGLEINKL
jgi:hypothetical protein